jgi:hypothetical protein
MRFQGKESSESRYGNSILRKVRPQLYIIICVLVIVGAYGYKLRIEGIFACPADRGYSSNAYLAYCNVTSYGDYDHGAFWFGLEPEAKHSAADAQVLFLGSSRMQFAFSAPVTKQWFSSSNLRHYLLGFSHTENSVFTAPLLEKISSKAKFYVINVDRFFIDKETRPVAEINSAKDVHTRYKQRRLWQYLHKPICSTFPALCGNELVYYRYRDHGDWRLRGSDKFKATAVADGAESNKELWDHYADLGEQFVSQLAVPKECILLTIVPSEETKRAEAESIARSLNLDLVAPQLESLTTFDGSHLDPVSAERWTKAFFDAAGPKILQCLETEHDLPGNTSS